MSLLLFFFLIINIRHWQHNVILMSLLSLLNRLLKIFPFHEDCWGRPFLPALRWSFHYFFLSTWSTNHIHNTTHICVLWPAGGDRNIRILIISVPLPHLHHQDKVLGLDLTVDQVPSRTLTLSNTNKHIPCGRKRKQPITVHLGLKCTITQFIATQSFYINMYMLHIFTYVCI